MKRENSRVRSGVDSLFSTTRGDILQLLCDGPRTVAEIAAKLSVTSNAIRAQLSRLERDALIAPAGSRPGVRRPHVDYHITPKGRALFPTAYEAVLNALIDALPQMPPNFSTQQLVDVVLSRLTGKLIAPPATRSSAARAAEFAKRVQSLGPGVRVRKEPNAVVIQSCSCPLASLTMSRPEICEHLATGLTRLLSVTVRERCDREHWPRCCFEISTAHA